MSEEIVDPEKKTSTDIENKKLDIKGIIDKIIIYFFLIFIPVLMILPTTFPNNDDILHRNLITHIAKLADVRNAYNYTLITGKVWQTNYTTPIRQIVPKKLRAQVTFFGNSLVRESYRYYKFHNVYFSKYGITQGTYRLHFVNFYCGTRWPFIENPRPWEYYNKVVLGFSYHVEFGHFLSDMLCGLIQIPKEDFEDAEIFIPFNLKASKDYCKYMGLNPDKVHELEHYYTYANEVSVYVSEEGINAFWIRGFKLLKEKLHQNLNLNSLKPTRYVILNRGPGLMRRLNNFEEIVAFVQTKYPQFNWEVPDPDIVYSIEDNSRLMASTLYLITTGGSNNFNGIFMQEGTYVVVTGSASLDYPNMAVYYAMNIWAIYTNGELTHSWVDNWKRFPLNTLEEAMKIMFHVMKHGNWPEYAATNYLYAWSIKDILKRAQKEKKVNPKIRLKRFTDFDNRLIK